MVVDAQQCQEKYDHRNRSHYFLLLCDFVCVDARERDTGWLLCVIEGGNPSDGEAAGASAGGRGYVMSRRSKWGHRNWQ